MALNEIKVPDWAWRPMERDSWIVLSHVWAGRSVGQEQVSACAGVWLLSGQTFFKHSCQVADLPQLPYYILFTPSLGTHG